MGDLFCQNLDTFLKLRNTCKYLIWNKETRNSCISKHSLLESKQGTLTFYRSVLNIKRVSNVIITNNVTERIPQIIVKGKGKFILKSSVHHHMIRLKQI